ncbi:translation initiation factor IF-2-like [Orcinus orca]|uniref:translation initiation factor IF-2-like n=1 Tax=Orcinus orca TaxID=9733 RepID=UPI002112404F|nr:translation initiation factor IF-2-like [Orcinus orca]
MAAAGSSCGSLAYLRLDVTCPLPRPSGSPGKQSRPRAPRGRLRPRGAPAPPTWPPRPTHQRARPRRPQRALGDAASTAARPGRGAQGSPRRCCCCCCRRRRRCCIPSECCCRSSSPPSASSRLSALWLRRRRRRRPPAPAPARRPRQSPGPRLARAALASPQPGRRAARACPLAPCGPAPRLPACRPAPRGGGERAPRRGAAGRQPRGTPPRRPPGAPARASSLPLAGRTGGPAGPALLSPASGPGPEVWPRTAQRRRAGVRTALCLLMPRDPAGRAPGAERAPSQGHRRTLTRHTLAPARPRRRVETAVGFAQELEMREGRGPEPCV